MISHKYKCIFVHIPKTAGTSIEDVIWPEKSDRTEANLWMGFIDKYHNKYQTGGLQHLTAEQIRKEVGEQFFQDYYKFAVIRNPWDRTVSQFVYMKERRDLRKFIGMRKKTSFEEYLQLIRKKEHVQWKKQVDFLNDENDKLMVPNLIRFEELVKGVNELFQHLNIEAILPHKKKSVRSHYSEYYNTATKEMVAEIYRKDINAFNYRFETPTDK